MPKATKHLLLALVRELVAAVVGVGVAKVHHLLSSFTMEYLLRALLFGEFEVFNQTFHFFFSDLGVVFDGFEDIVDLSLGFFELALLCQLDAAVHGLDSQQSKVGLNHTRIGLSLQSCTFIKEFKLKRSLAFQLSACDCILGSVAGPQDLKVSISI